MCSETSSLSQIKRIKSEDIKREPKRMSNFQRRISFDLIRSSTAETNMNRGKDRPVVQRTSIRKDSFVNHFNSYNTRIRAKSSTGRKLLNSINAVPVFGDHKTILEGSQMLELISKLEVSQSFATYSRQQINVLFVKRGQLLNLLQQKCKITVKEDCLGQTLKANTLIQELKLLYIEDNNKLNFLKTVKSDDKRKGKLLDNFIKDCKSRKALAYDIDQKSSSWISLITNANRLISVTHMFPNDDGLDLIIQNTVKELKYLGFCSTYLLRFILQINIEIMCLLIDLLPFECISDICISCQHFNQLLTSKLIKPLDLISVVASFQAKVATNKFLYYLYNETNKNMNSMFKNESLSLNNIIEEQLKLEEITSDYFSASSHSTLNQTRKQSNYNPKIQKDLKTVFNILIQTNQRILLKIIFGNQENNDNNQTKSSGSRQKWFKFKDDSVEKQQRLSQEYDKLFWDKFWTEFNDIIEISLCFANSDKRSFPISALYNQKKATLISSILENCIRDDELLPEAVKSLETAQYYLLLRLAFQKWGQNHMKLTNQTEKSSLKITISEDESRIGTLIGITLINAVEPLLAIKVKYSGDSNAFEAIIDNLLNNTVDVFVACVERKQSLQPDSELTSFIALTVLDINNMNELLSNLDIKWINSFVVNLNNIKKSAIIKVKQNLYYKSYELISKIIPSKEYRKKICSVNSDWIESAISLILEPITYLLAKDSSFESNILHSNLIEEFSKALFDCIFKDNKLKLKFSYSGAIQFNKDIEVFWDWIVRNDLQSTNSSAITQLKSTSFSLININKIALNKRCNKVSPTVSFIQTNEMTDSSATHQNMRIRERNCFSLFPCSEVCNFIHNF